MDQLDAIRIRQVEGRIISSSKIMRWIQEAVPLLPIKDPLKIDVGS